MGQVAKVTCANRQQTSRYNTDLYFFQSDGGSICPICKKKKGIGKDACNFQVAMSKKISRSYANAFCARRDS